MALKFSKVKTVSANKFELPEEKEVFLKVISEMRTVHKKEVVGDDGKVKEPASQIPAALVVDLESGETGELLMTQVFADIMRENYPENTLNGKAFRVVKKKVPGKRYFNYEIDEIEVETEAKVG